MKEQKTIFITGAASGIGRAAAELFVSKGWFVGLYDINLTEISKLHESLGSENTCYGKLDVTSAVSVREALEHFEEHSRGRLDVLFNSAGLFSTGPFETIDLERQRQIAEVNLTGVLNCTYLAFPLLKKSAPARVISMASGSALYGTPDMVSYSATKFAVRGFSEALNIEWERHGIHVCDIIAPFVNTPMVRNVDKTHSMKLLGIRLSAEDVAQTVWKATRGKKVHYIMTLQFKLLWFISGLAPGWMNRLTTRLIGGY